MGRTPVRVQKVLDVLAGLYPDARCALDHRNAFELLIATILSAQCTDKRVNLTTPALFARFPDAAALAGADVREVEQLIAECGLFKTKARNIVAASRQLVERCDGEVPDEREALEALPGVGRKTASVVLSNAFGVPALAVDTHVFRVANRLGLAKAATVEKTEEQLCARIPRRQWSQAHHWLIHHGRQVCHARSPQCSACALASLCDDYRSRERRLRQV
ncbi:MAG: endonuclease III [Firmicutes bacterium]|nr:endonuclease III [Bacillota bacterium]